MDAFGATHDWSCVGAALKIQASAGWLVSFVAIQHGNFYNVNISAGSYVRSNTFWWNGEFVPEQCRPQIGMFLYLTTAMFRMLPMTTYTKN